MTILKITAGSQDAQMPVSACVPQLLSRQTTKHDEMNLLNFLEFNLVELFLNDQNNQQEVSHNLPILTSIFLDHLLFLLIILKIKAYRKLKWVVREFQPGFEEF